MGWPTVAHPQSGFRGISCVHNEFARIIDILPGLVWSALPDGRVEFVNARCREYTGLDLRRLSDSAWQAAIHPEDLPQWLEHWRSTSTSDQPWELELRLRRFDGEYRWFLCRACPETDASARVVRWCGINSDIDDQRRRAENDLRTVETNFSGWVESFPGLMVTMSTAGQVELFSQEVLDYFGTTREELRSWALTDAVHPDDLPRVVAAFTESVSTGKPYSIEHRCRRADGVYRWFQIRALAVRDQDEQITGWYVVLVDIDDVKRAEDAVRANESNLALIINTIPVLAWSASADGHAEFFNQHYLDFVGLSSEQVRDWGWLAAVHADDLNGLAATWQEIMASERLGETEARLRRHDGEYRWFLFRASPLRDDTGTIVKWFGVNTDIEDRKRAETELRRAYDSFADAQRLSKTGSFITDLVADDHNWSAEAYRIFEFEPGTKVTVQRIQQIVHPDDLPAFESVIRRGMSGVDVNFAFRIVTARGAVKHVRGIAHVIEQIEGRPMFVGALQDVTESMIAEEALNRARSELARVARVTTVSALTASITHEVNQPLTGIITNASTCLRMLSADPPNLDGARETVRRTIRDGNRAADVITRLRALFSNKGFTLESLDLNEATREVITLSLTDLQRNRVVLQSELADDLPPVTGDRVQLQQVILNLLRNASDAMADVHDRPRQLLVKTEHEAGNRVRLSVQDVGVGLDRQNMDRLFDAFYTTKGGGMGIGLSVSRSIIERHHGRIWAAPNDGPGTMFAFWIPCEPMQPADSSRDVRALSGVSTESRSVPIDT
jgi:PAS domain S-box-containing protein